jgi:hypothetical protein
VDLSTGIQLPSIIKDTKLRKEVDLAMQEADIEPIRTRRGYQLAVDDSLPAVDASLKIIASKIGTKSTNLKLTVDKSGELFIPTNMNLSGYQIQIKRGSKILNKLDVL